MTTPVQITTRLKAVYLNSIIGKDKSVHAIPLKFLTSDVHVPKDKAAELAYEVENWPDDINVDELCRERVDRYFMTHHGIDLTQNPPKVGYDVLHTVLSTFGLT